MFEKLNISEEMKSFFLKIIIPAFVALSIKIAIQSKDKKLTIFEIFISFFAGIGFAYLFSDFVMTTFSHQWIPLAIAVIAISGEKMGYWLINKFKVEKVIEGFVKKYTK